MKFFKKTITAILVLCVAAATLSFAACTDDASGGEVAETSDIDIQNFEYGFIDADSYDADTTMVADCSKNTSMNGDTDYYFILQFDIAARQANKGTALLTINIGIDDIDIVMMTGIASESNGASISMGSLEFVAPSTGSNSIEYYADIEIPESVDSPETVYIVMELVPVSVGQANIYLSYEADGFEIYGDQNYELTEELTVNAVQLGKPAVSWDGDTQTLGWYQIKNADYYLFYVDGELLYDSNGKVVTVEANPDIAAGDEVLFTKLPDYISGDHTVSVQACSDYILYESSSLSDSVYVTIS